MPYQVELVDHLRTQQRHQVREHAVPEARERLLAQRGAADDGRAIQHHDIQAGPGQVGRGDQTVVAGADDDRVEAAAAAGRIGYGRDAAHEASPKAAPTAVLRAGLKNGRLATRARARRRP